MNNIIQIIVVLSSKKKFKLLDAMSYWCWFLYHINLKKYCYLFQDFQQVQLDSKTVVLKTKLWKNKRNWS